VQLVVPPVVVFAVVEVMPPAPTVGVLAPPVLVALLPLVPLVTVAAPVTLLVVAPAAADVFEVELWVLVAASVEPAGVSEAAGSSLQARALALNKHAIPSGYRVHPSFMKPTVPGPAPRRPGRRGI